MTEKRYVLDEMMRDYQETPTKKMSKFRTAMGAIVLVGGLAGGIGSYEALHQKSVELERIRTSEVQEMLTLERKIDYIREVGLTYLSDYSKLKSEYEQVSPTIRQAVHTYLSERKRLENYFAWCGFVSATVIGIGANILGRLRCED